MILIYFYGFICLFGCTMAWIILGSKVKDINDDEDI